jgi:hypothetical protein
MTVRQPNRLFIDIETVASPDAQLLLPEPKIDKRIKDEVKIAAAREEKLAEALELAPLDPDLATIALISMQIGTQGDPTILLIDRPEIKISARLKKLLTTTCYTTIMTEAAAIQTFWKYFAMCGGRAVGYNIISFDIPFLLRRSFDLGVKPAVIPNLAKYRVEPLTDLFCLLFNWNWQGSKKLKWVCTRYGIEVLAPEVDGSMVKDLSPKELVEYGLSDLHATVELFKRMNGYYFAMWDGPTS